jgi:hypothetical protein
MLKQHLQLPVLTSEIEKILKLLGDSASFFRKIAQMNCENGFKKGRIHCEACLASLIVAGATKNIDANEDYRRVLAATKVSNGVLPRFNHQSLITSDRTSEVSLGYRNVAVLHALISSNT